MDNSCGHYRKQEVGLNIYKINLNWGRKQMVMHTSEIKYVDGFLGTLPSILKPGDIQKFWFVDSDDGPFYLTKENAIERK